MDKLNNSQFGTMSKVEKVVNFTKFILHIQ